ncbi:hypothetical protein KQI36_00095 [Clostridium senegalense]|uniref:hypothetical protein n=1 Tax=Clostridium senegalense TaxID=1465809 RepID=UPI001C0FE032|nr:hypothetical protein [Clostridium senegalense]MBU5225063.1 hypothetical protein [Clostridium senegalense]
MKKKAGLAFILLIIVSTFIFVNAKKQDYGVGSNVSNAKLELKLKGLKGAKDFVKDNLDNYYIAFKKRIIVVEKDGKSYTVVSNKDFDIKSMDYKDSILYFSSGNKIYSYNLQSEKLKECIDNIPNFGDYKDVFIKVSGNYLIASVGAATNSGVVGEDNHWTKEFPLEKDHSAKELILKEVNLGKDNTGAFKEKGKESFDGQVIPGEKIGNSTLIMYNLENEQYETFAWGIRNITGLDFSSKGKIYASVGGMEYRGVRPICNDKDYIYEIKKDEWYGFPDFSGGDPVTSPKFMDEDEKTESFLLSKHPNPTPQGPEYEHDKVSAIKSLAVDSKGVLGETDDIYFYDDIEKCIFVCSSEKTAKEFISLGKKSNVKSIKTTNSGIGILETSQGCLYEANINDTEKSMFNSAELFTYVIAILLTAVIVTTFFVIK